MHQRLGQRCGAELPDALYGAFEHQPGMVLPFAVGAFTDAFDGLKYFERGGEEISPLVCPG